ncbi:hypothetical protein BDA99DRAFT_600407 [Phascolomyces articulosus]|uniref:F-box domain-containing protein n=1 Tax=Phascolomyces articulosus TaxID=60185 RepID=A0AAD5KSJ5_9FUNG|nr:hypothetical protein BDA99DRAFT_600407 [Phascolomyces articulosus]
MSKETPPADATVPAATKEMIESSLSHLIDQLNVNTIHDINEGHYNAAVNNSTKMINRLLKSTAILLESRSMAWKKQGKIEQELQDALLMIEHSPTNIRGYIAVAEIYSVQGKQEQALTILKKGLQRATTLDDNERDIDQQNGYVYETMNTIKKRLERRIDFIVQASLDVVGIIFGYLNIDTVNICMDVNHTWRAIVQTCPEAWRYMNRVGDKLFWTSQRALSLFPSVSQYVRKIDTSAEPEELTMCLTDIETYKFSQLQSLSASLHNSY